MPSASCNYVECPEATIFVMGWTPGDHYCDLCGAVTKQYGELVKLARESGEGGSAEVCSACLSRPIADLVAVLVDPARRARPATRRVPARSTSMWERLFG